MDGAELTARGVRVVRGGKAILRGLDLEARAGDVLGVLGPSGAGKSTLFRVLVGESTADAGQVLLAGRDVSAWPLWKRARAGVGYVPQGPSVLWDLTVRENLEAYRRVARVRTGSATASAAHVGLDDRLDVVAGQLSGGERRRLELARALTGGPRVLVCDEPFAGVDPAGATRLAGLLADLARAGAAVLLADHHADEALRVCTRAVLLLDGAIAVDASPDDFRAHPLVRGRYLGTLGNRDGGSAAPGSAEPSGP